MSSIIYFISLMMELIDNLVALNKNICSISNLIVALQIYKYLFVGFVVLDLFEQHHSTLVLYN